MPVKAKTTEEYLAMAMLLGYKYNRAYHVFDALPHEPIKCKWINPDTLQEMAMESLRRRINQWQEKELAPVTMEGNNDPTENRS